MPRRSWLTLFPSILLISSAMAADPEVKGPGWLLPMPEIDADPRIPTLKSVVGHGWGEDISSVAEIERYLRALADAAPDRAKLIPYGQTIAGAMRAWAFASSTLVFLGSASLRLAARIASIWARLAGEVMAR